MTGFLNIRKEEGASSAYVVSRVRRLVHTPCGHMGTLDPLASGVLPVGIGNATRLFDFFLDKKKTYLAHFRFGVTTDTLDGEGAVRPAGRVPSRAEIEGVLPGFIGEIDQLPPKYSAKSVNGRRSYELARAGQEVELSPKRVRIEGIELLEQTGADEFSFRIVCGGGTYIRALARDIATKLGTGAYMSGLVREGSGPFSLETAVRLSDLTPENVAEHLIPTDSVLPFPSISVEDKRYFQGVRIPCAREDGLYKIYSAEGFYGLGRVEGGELRPEKKLC